MAEQAHDPPEKRRPTLTRGPARAPRRTPPARAESTDRTRRGVIAGECRAGDGLTTECLGDRVGDMGLYG